MKDLVVHTVTPDCDARAVQGADRTPIQHPERWEGLKETFQLARRELIREVLEKPEPVDSNERFCRSPNGSERLQPLCAIRQGPSPAQDVNGIGMTMKQKETELSRPDSR